MSPRLFVLGTNAGSMSAHRYPSGYLMQLDKQKILFDCGECTQFKLRDLKVKFSSIDIIAITHLHGDHYLGLPGLLHTMSMQGRKQAITIICPKDLENILDLQFNLIHNKPDFPINYVHTDSVQEEESPLLFENTRVRIYGVKLRHRIHTCGFKVEEIKNLRKVNSDAIKTLNLDKESYTKLQHGFDIDWQGKVFSNSELTLPNTKGFSFAYLTDTIYFPELAKQVNGYDAIFHEATYSEQETNRAEEHAHSTSIQAAQIAQAAEVKQLLIGHYSSRYDDIKVLEKEAKTIFSETLALEECMILDWEGVFKMKQE